MDFLIGKGAEQKKLGDKKMNKRERERARFSSMYMKITLRRKNWIWSFFYTFWNLQQKNKEGRSLCI